MNGDDAVNDVIDTLLSLVRVMEEESERLALAGPGAPVTELAQAKVRLAGRLDQLGARLEREDADWMRRVEGDQRESLHRALGALNEAALVNSDILERQIALSGDLLGAIGAEMERLTGRRSTTYGRMGDMRRRATRAPLAVNQKY